MRKFTVQANGNSYQIDDDRSLREWLAQWQLDTVRPFVVAVNDEHVAHAQLALRTLEPGDRIEVLTVCQGG